MKPTEPWMSAEDAAEFIGVHINTLYLYCQQHTLPYSRVGKLYRFNRDVLTNWLLTMPEAEPKMEAAHD